MISVVIKFLLEVKNNNGDVNRIFEEIKDFPRDLQGYLSYKKYFLSLCDSFIKRIDCDFFRLVLLVETVDDRLSRAGKLLFKNEYATIEELQKGIIKAAESNFPSLWNIWRKNLSREFNIKISEIRKGN